MNRHEKSELPHPPVTRREFIQGSAVAAVIPVLGVEALSRNTGMPLPKKKPPNIIIIIADQFRWDAVGAYGLNSVGLTPHLDSMTRRGTLFRSHIANQPVCAPSRANLFTGQYQNRNGVWKNGLGLASGTVTLAATLRQAGYTANYIGKWHMARPGDHHPAPAGPVAADHSPAALMTSGRARMFWSSPLIPMRVTSTTPRGSLFISPASTGWISSRSAPFGSCAKPRISRFS